MGTRGVIALTTAPAGSGKTYRRGPHFLINDFLPQREGAHWSNFPLFRDKIAEAMEKKTGTPASEVVERIKLIPHEVQERWRTGESGPWEYFADVDLQDAHIAIDEFHEFCGTNKSRALREKYQFWFGQIRHRGATIEVISQAPEKIAREIHYEAGVQLSLVNSEDRRDPWCRILLGDWYELRAKFITGKYQSAVWEIEERKAKGKWVQEDSRVFWLDAYYFQFYDSYSKPTDGNTKAMAQKREYQKRSAPGLLLWFIRRNFFKLASRAAVVGFLVWFVCGGLTSLMLASINVSNSMVAKSMKEATDKAAFQEKAGHKGPEQVVGSGSGYGPSNGSIGTPARHAGNPDLMIPATFPANLTVARTATMPWLVPATMPEAVASQKELQELQGALERERSRREQLEKRAAADSLVVLLSKDSLTLRDGQTYRPGERIKGGPKDGRTVISIDWNRREVVLDDGSSIRLGGNGSGSGNNVGNPAPGSYRLQGLPQPQAGDPPLSPPLAPAAVPGYLYPSQRPVTQPSPSR